MSTNALMFAMGTVDYNSAKVSYQTAPIDSSYKNYYQRRESPNMKTTRKPILRYVATAELTDQMCKCLRQIPASSNKRSLHTTRVKILAAPDAPENRHITVKCLLRMCYVRGEGAGQDEHYERPCR